jgi:hypothetical protein
MAMEATNLLDIDCLCALDKQGQAHWISITELLTHADQYADLRHPNPMDDVAVYRLLVAMLHWCAPAQSPAAIAGVLRHTAPASATTLAGWLAQLRPHMELLGTGPRFYQYGSAAKLPERPIADLFVELPGATNITHFVHTRDGVTQVCLACVARGLIRLPAFCQSGGQGKQPSINRNPPLYFLPVQHDIIAHLETLLPIAARAGDRPVWQGPNPANEVGLLEAYTWMPRAVYLHPVAPEQRTACALCGATSRTTFAQLVFDARATKVNTEAEEKGAPLWRDPMAAYFPDKKTDLPRSARHRDPLGSFSVDQEWITLARCLMNPTAGRPEFARADYHGAIKAVYVPSDKAKTIHYGQCLQIIPANFWRHPQNSALAGAYLDQIQTTIWQLHKTLPGALGRATPKNAEGVVASVCAGHSLPLHAQLQNQFWAYVTALANSPADTPPAPPDVRPIFHRWLTDMLAALPLSNPLARLTALRQVNKKLAAPASGKSAKPRKQEVKS